MTGKRKAKVKAVTELPEHSYDRRTDPSALTTSMVLREVEVIKEDLINREAARHREIASLRDLFTIQVENMEKATDIRSEKINSLPGEMETQIKHLRELMEEKFSSVGTQFKERDTRSEREARDNKLAVDAAFAAQEKQAVAQNESNALAISKSESATAETIKTNRDLSLSETHTLIKTVDELKLQVNTIIASGITTKENRNENRDVRGDNRGNVSMIVGIIGGSVGFISFMILIFDVIPK